MYWDYWLLMRNLCNIAKAMFRNGVLKNKEKMYKLVRKYFLIG